MKEQTPQKVHISVDSGPLSAAMLSLAKLPAERLDLFFDELHGSVEFVCVDLDASPTSGAGDLRIVLKPGVFLLEFLAASGAGNGQFEVV